MNGRTLGKLSTAEYSRSTRTHVKKPLILIVVRSLALPLRNSRRIAFCRSYERPKPIDLIVRTHKNAQAWILLEGRIEP